MSGQPKWKLPYWKFKVVTILGFVQLDILGWIVSWKQRIYGKLGWSKICEPMIMMQLGHRSWTHVLWASLQCATLLEGILAYPDTLLHM